MDVNAIVLSGETINKLVAVILADPGNRQGLHRKPRGRPIDPNSKFQRSRALFSRVKARRYVTAAMREQLSLTRAGAQTYYQKLKTG